MGSNICSFAPPNIFPEMLTNQSNRFMEDCISRSYWGGAYLIYLEHCIYIYLYIYIYNFNLKKPIAVRSHGTRNSLTVTREVLNNSVTLHTVAKPFNTARRNSANTLPPQIMAVCRNRMDLTARAVCTTTAICHSPVTSLIM